MNRFVGVPQPDSPHKPLLNLVDSVHIGAGRFALHLSSQASRLRGWLLARKPRVVPLFGTRNLERFEENFGAPSVRLRRTACGTTAGRRCRSKAIAIRMNTYDSSVSETLWQQMLSQTSAGTAKSARFCSGVDETWRTRQDSYLCLLPQRILAAIVVVRWIENWRQRHLNAPIVRHLRCEQSPQS